MVKIRIIGDEEKEQLLNARNAGIDYGPYRDAIANLKVGDVAAVAVDGHEKRERMRFQKAAVQLEKRLSWLPNPSDHEIAFEVVLFPPQPIHNQRIGKRRG